MESLKLDAKSTALILIDLQHGVVGMQGAAPYTTSAVVEKGAALAKVFREKGGTIVYVRVDLNDFLRLPVDMPYAIPDGTPAIASEIVPESGVQPTDLIITKRHWGAFSGTDLEALLRKAGIGTIVMGGISTNIGVETTARNAAGLGFALVVVEDACTDRDAATHQLSFDRIFPRLGRVRKTAEVIEALD